ncbi:MAG: phosphopantothenoylcysteine decarboxylase [Candidatus Omnitrophica bacterium]|nr:phosphopantothenoylcysteine decarboxylase [Candidatus Omnitrophota bacterium]
MKILISAGPTREYIDPVRFISNPSTGKMGYLIAEECLKKGHSVVIVSGPTHLKPPGKARLLRVETAEEMRKEILKRFPKADALIMTAAVSDWRPAKKHRGKLKRKKAWELKLVPNPDILKEAVRIKRKNQTVVGFALETSDILKNAGEKLKEKKLDLIVADTPDFLKGKDSKVVFILKDGRVEKFSRLDKRQTAVKTVKLLEEL